MARTQEEIQQNLQDYVKKVVREYEQLDEENRQLRIEIEVLEAALEFERKDSVVI